MLEPIAVKQAVTPDQMDEFLQPLARGSFTQYHAQLIKLFPSRDTERGLDGESSHRKGQEDAQDGFPDHERDSVNLIGPVFGIWNPLSLGALLTHQHFQFIESIIQFQEQ